MQLVALVGKTKIILTTTTTTIPLESYGETERSNEWEIRTPSSGKENTTWCRQVYTFKKY